MHAAAVLVIESLSCYATVVCAKFTQPRSRQVAHGPLHLGACPLHRQRPVPHLDCHQLIGCRLARWIDRDVPVPPWSSLLRLGLLVGIRLVRPKSWVAPPSASSSSSCSCSTSSSCTSASSLLRCGLRATRVGAHQGKAFPSCLPVRLETPASHHSFGGWLVDAVLLAGVEVQFNFQFAFLSSH